MSPGPPSPEPKDPLRSDDEPLAGPDVRHLIGMGAGEYHRAVAEVRLELLASGV